MEAKLSYGRNGLTVNLPYKADLIQNQFVDGIKDETAAIRQALRTPINSQSLSEKVKKGDRVVIVHSDITRATPNGRLLPVIIDELEQAGIRSQDIVLLNALGTHRKQTDIELRAMLGDRLVEKYTCIQHDAFASQELITLGQTSFGHPVRINRHYLEADVRILTGFIEPHFFAGFSGGPKGVLPALAGSESVLTNHGFEMIANPKATWGVTEGNPIWEEMLEMAQLTKPTFLVNVTMNNLRQITGVYAGELKAAHAEGCRQLKEHAMVKVEHPYDIVITTNSGYPLDQNLYQSVKGMSAASRIVKPGGSIIIAAACEDGIPNHGEYAHLLEQCDSPDAVLEMVGQPGFSMSDQWQVQVQATVQKKAGVYVYSDGLTDEQIRKALLIPCRDIERTVSEIVRRNGSETSICVVPDGPLTVAYLGD